MDVKNNSPNTCIKLYKIRLITFCLIQENMDFRRKLKFLNNEFNRLKKSFKIEYVSYDILSDKTVFTIKLTLISAFIFELCSNL